MDKRLPSNPQAISTAKYGMAVESNSTKSLVPWGISTGLKTWDLRRRTSTFDNEKNIAEDFLLNSRLVRNDRENELSVVHYFEDSSALMISLGQEQQELATERFSLPPAVPLEMSIGTAIGKRRSQRLYSGDNLPGEYLASLLTASVGYTGTADVGLSGGEHITMRYRATPSGGGLYPVKIFIAALNVNDVRPGIYSFDPIHCSLIHYKDESAVTALRECVAVPDEALSISRANAIFLFVGQPWKSMRKYGPRGMRLVFLEAGYIAQNIHLAASALGWGTVDCSSFYDDEVHEVLGVDGIYEALIHAVILGCPT